MNRIKTTKCDCDAEIGENHKSDCDYLQGFTNRYNLWMSLVQKVADAYQTEQYVVLKMLDILTNPKGDVSIQLLQTFVEYYEFLDIATNGVNK